MDLLREIENHKNKCKEKQVKRILLFSAPTFDFDSFDIGEQRKDWSYDLSSYWLTNDCCCY